jgi:hypothetical protein
MLCDSFKREDHFHFIEEEGWDVGSRSDELEPEATVGGSVCALCAGGLVGWWWYKVDLGVGKLVRGRVHGRRE